MNETILQEMELGQSFNFGFRVFLDKFYVSKPEERTILIEKGPSKRFTRQEQAFLAASVDLLCRNAKMEPPLWIYEEQLTLKEPWFPSAKVDQARMLALYESPPEFKARNIFVWKNVLSRAREYLLYENNGSVGDGA